MKRGRGRRRGKGMKSIEGGGDLDFVLLLLTDHFHLLPLFEPHHIASLKICLIK
jgi:hypothetical protein